MSETDQFVIEKGIPIPSEKAIRGFRINTLRSMNIGDSTTDSYWNRTRWHMAATRIGYGVRTQKLSLNKVRIWRTA